MYVREWDAVTYDQVGTTRHLFSPSNPTAESISSEPIVGFPFEPVSMLSYQDSQIIAAGKTGLAVFGESQWPDLVSMPPDMVARSAQIVGAYSNGGDRVVYGSSTGEVIEYSLTDDEAASQIPTYLAGSKSLAPSPNGSHFAVAADGGVMIGATDGSQIIGKGVNIEDLDPLTPLDNTLDDFASVASSGRFAIASNSGPGSGGRPSGQPLLYDLTTSALTHLEVRGDERVALTVDHTDADIAALVEGDSGRYDLIDLRTGSAIASLSDVDGSVTLSPDRETIIYKERSALLTPPISGSASIGSRSLT